MATEKISTVPRTEGDLRSTEPEEKPGMLFVRLLTTYLFLNCCLFVYLCVCPVSNYVISSLLHLLRFICMLINNNGPKFPTFRGLSCIEITLYLI